MSWVLYIEQAIIQELSIACYNLRRLARILNRAHELEPRFIFARQ